MTDETIILELVREAIDSGCMLDHDHFDISEAHANRLYELAWGIIHQIAETITPELIHEYIKGQPS